MSPIIGEWRGLRRRLNRAKQGYFILFRIEVILHIRYHQAKSTGKRPLGRPRRRWEDNIRMDLEEIGIMRVIGLIRLRIGIIGEPL